MLRSPKTYMSFTCHDYISKQVWWISICRFTKYWYLILWGNLTFESWLLTLTMGSRSQKLQFLRTISRTIPIFMSSPVTLQMRSGSPKCNQLLMIYQCKFGEIPYIGSRNIIATEVGCWHRHTPTQTGFQLKQYFPLTFGGGGRRGGGIIISELSSSDLLIPKLKA